MLAETLCPHCLARTTPRPARGLGGLVACRDCRNVFAPQPDGGAALLLPNHIDVLVGRDRFSVVVRGFFVTFGQAPSHLSFQLEHNEFSWGREIALIKADEKKFGKRAVEWAAWELGYAAKTLYECATVAEMWPDGRAFESLLKRKNSKGLTLTFSHFSVLAKVRHASTRESLLARALGASWSVRDLLAHVPEPKEEARPRDTSKYVVARVARTAERAVKAIGVDLVALGKLAPVPADDTETRARLEAALEGTLRAQALGGAVVAKLQALLRRAVPPGEPPGAPPAEPSLESAA
jgi:hypothetical protein